MRCILVLRDDNLEAMGSRLGVTGNHLRNVLVGRRNASRKLAEAMFVELGGAAWNFVTGVSNELRVEDVA